MKHLNKSLLALSIIVLLAGCTTLYTGIVTVNDVVKSAMKEWAHISNLHQTTPEIDAKVVEAHNKYRQACAVAEDALIAYKKTGDQAEYLRAAQTVKAMASTVIDLIVPLISPSKGSTLENNLAKAVVL